MGFLLKLLIVLLLARLLVGVVRYLMKGSRKGRERRGQDNVQGKRQRARQHLDADIVDAEFEDITDKHKHKQR